ncbi:hypothetical protein Q1J68_22085, partial [Pseudomonas pergaminensis]|uniref:hypothetical protein n=1 Tax=Pseudomonas pergaminensis TaxID=2853159 RepID=UPI0034D529FE
STAPEVGRIIDFQNLPSTHNLVFLSKNQKTSRTTLYKPPNRIIEQYIAQRRTVKHHSAHASLNMTLDEHPQ